MLPSSYPESFGTFAYAIAKGDDWASLLPLIRASPPATLDVPARNGATALSRAAQFDRVESVRLLLDAGADPNRPANAPDGPRTPLDAAYRRELRSPDGPEIVRALIAAGATVPNQ